MRTKCILVFAIGLLVNAVSNPLYAGVITFGFDRDSADGTLVDASSNSFIDSAGTRVLLGGSNSEAAQISFIAAISGFSYGTEDFEGPYGTPLPSGPLGLEFGSTGVTATLTGLGSVNEVTSVISTTPSDFVHRSGRYPVSGTHYWDTNLVPLEISVTSFSSPIRAFGFFMTDAGDFNGQVQLNISYVSGAVENVTINHPFDTDPLFDFDPPPSYNASLLYFGFEADTADRITGFAFTNTRPELGDQFGLDDITIAVDATNITTLPEPSSFMLVISAALTCTLGWRRRFRRIANSDK